MVDTVFKIIGGPVCSILSFWLLIYFINKKFEPKPKMEIIAPIFFASLVTILEIFLYYFTVYLPVTVLFVLLFLYVRVSRKGGTLEMAFWVVVDIWALGLAQTISGTVYSVLFGLPPMMAENQFFSMSPSFSGFQIIIMYSSSIILQISFIYFLVHKINKTKVSNNIMAVLVLLSLISSMILDSMTGLYRYINFTQAEYGPIVLYVLLGVIIVNIAIFILYNHIRKLAEKSLQQQVRLQKAELQQVHYSELKALYQETRAWRHDYRNHLQVIKIFAGKGDYEGLDSYLSEIDQSLNTIDFRINSGYDLLDAIVNSKITRAENDNIKFTHDIAPVKNDTISAVDLTALIGNLLDNSIEACERMKDNYEEKYINLKILNPKNQLIISIENPTNGFVIKQGEKYISSKNSPQHGIGLQQIDNIVAKYDGYIFRKVEDNIFHTFIRIPIEKSAREEVEKTLKILNQVSS